MKYLHPILGIFFCLLVFACTTNSADKEIPQNQAPEQKLQVASKTSPAPDVKIGKRSAEEMVAAGFKRYGIEKGILIFRMDGAVNGTENLYFDHWGWREGKYIQTESDIGAYDKKTNKIQFLDGERRYDYNPNTGEAHFFASKQVQRSADRYGTKDMTVVGDEMIKNMGGVPNGIKEVRGVECQVWNIENYKAELSMWKGITMWERSTPNNIPVARSCILLDTTSAIPLEKLVLPDHIKVRGVD